MSNINNTKIDATTIKSLALSFRSKNSGALFAWVSIVVVILFFTLVTVGVFTTQDNAVNPVTFAMLVINGILGLVELWRSMKDAPYSLRQVHWVFYLIFFVITPIQQYGLGQWPWECVPTEDQVRYACVLVFVWGVVFAVLTNHVGLSKQVDPTECDAILSRPIEYSFPAAAVPVFTVIAVLATCVLVSNVGFSNMFLRVESHADYGSKTVNLLVDVLTRGFVFISFALLYLNYVHTRKSMFSVAIAGVCVLLTCFPTALARFNIAVIYLGLALLALPIFAKRRGLFVLCLLMGFLVAYPVFNVFKYVDGSSTLSEILSSVFSSISSNYTSGNYDGFSLLFWVINYTEEAGFSNGIQLLGALFFFVPRTVWPSKPVPSGELVFTYYDYAFTDLSCPLPCEGYINFGIIGVIAFGVVYGCVVRLLDTRYWSHRLSNQRDIPTITAIYYPFFLSLSFYMLRGALMNTLTFVIGDLFVCVCLIALIGIIQRIDRSHLDVLRETKPEKSSCLDYLVVRKK